MEVEPNLALAIGAATFSHSTVQIIEEPNRGTHRRFSHRGLCAWGVCSGWQAGTRNGWVVMRGRVAYDEPSFGNPLHECIPATKRRTIWDLRRPMPANFWATPLQTLQRWPLNRAINMSSPSRAGLRTMKLRDEYVEAAQSAMPSMLRCFETAATAVSRCSMSGESVEPRTGARRCESQELSPRATPTGDAPRGL